MNTPSMSNKKKRASYFRQNQRLLKLDKRALFDKIINGEEFEKDVIPPLDEIKKEYEKIFCDPSPKDDKPYNISIQNPSYNFARLITKNEINTALKTSKSNSAGLDGIKLVRGC